MRLLRFLTLSTVPLLILAGCGPKPKATSASPISNALATYDGGEIRSADWDNWKSSAGFPADLPAREQARAFDEYLRFKIEALEARSAGLAKDSSRNKRFLSIQQRILAERFRTDVIVKQFGVHDTTLDKWIVGVKDSALLALSPDSLRKVGARKIALGALNTDSLYAERKESLRRPDSTIPPLDSVKTRLQDEWLQASSDAIMRDLIPALRAQYKVELVPVKPTPVSQDTLRAFWAANPENWSSTPLYRLAALQASAKDSAKLTKALAKVKTRDAFVALASKFPVGTPAAPKGELGRVKRHFALPYGIGMVPDLFQYLDTAKIGSQIPPLRLENGKWLVVWLDGRDSGETKSFESVAEDVAAQYTAANPWTPPASTVLATWDKGTLFTRADVDFISEEVPAQMRRNYPADRVLDFMILWRVVARASQETGHSARPAVRKALADNEGVYWAQAWRQTPDAQAFLVPAARRDSAFRAWGSLFPEGSRIDSSEGVNRDGARLALMPKGFLSDAYSIDIDKYRKDSVSFQPFDSVSAKIFQDQRAALDELGRIHLEAALRSKYHVKLSELAPKAPSFGSPREQLDSARALHDRRSLEEAEQLYVKLAKDTTAADSLRAQALFQLGQLHGEQQVYQKSLSTYRELLLRFPKSNEAYKAQFMIAFTYSEYLKDEKAALTEYRKMQAFYPTSDLTDDADWMIRNIESGGALMPKFDDSTAVSDSAVVGQTVPQSNPGKAANPASSKAPVAPKANAATGKTEEDDD